MARLADGWLASGYNATPDRFAEARQRLGGHLRRSGIDPEGFPNTIATMFMHVTEDPSEADALLRRVLAPTLGRSPEELADRLLVGSAGACAERIGRFDAGGAGRILLWPVGDELRQLERFHDEVIPRLSVP